MKVYELMNILADMPSGADVFCCGCFTVKELKSKENCGDNDSGDLVYSFASDVSEIDYTDGKAYINF